MQPTDSNCTNLTTNVVTSTVLSKTGNHCAFDLQQTHVLELNHFCETKKQQQKETEQKHVTGYLLSI